MQNGGANKCTTAQWQLGTMAGVAMVFTALPTSAAQAQSLNGVILFFTSSVFSLTAILIAIAAFTWAFLVIRKLARDDISQRKRIADIEAQLNEAEQALAAEPCVLIIWRGREQTPGRIVGDMRGAAAVPTQPEQLLDLDLWLEAESSASLVGGIAELRERGAPFNIGVRTLAGELLEADGRTAGGLATLRLRPLAGERLSFAALEFDARTLGKQVERLSAILDAAPLPVWLREDSGELIWVNRAYVKAVEASDVDDIVARKTEISALKPNQQSQTGEDGIFMGRDHTVIGGAKRALDIYEVKLGEGSAGFAIDVSALEEAQKELHRHIDAHASTLDKLTTAIAIFGPDQRLRFYNAAYATLWDFDAAYLGTSPSDGEILDRLRERRLLPEQANFRDWKARQLTAYTNIETPQDWWYLPDGRSLHVVTEQHPFGGVTYFYENDTNRIQLQSRLNELAGVQHETLDNLSEGVALFGMDGKLKLSNPAFATLLSLSSELFAGPAHVDAIVAAGRATVDDDLHWDEIKYGVTGLESDRKAMKGRVKRRDNRVLAFASVPLPDGNTLITYADATDSSRIEAALRERAEALETADRLKTGFMANVSYQLRTPLTNIIGYSEALTGGYAGPLQPKQRDYVGYIETSSQELLAVINAILDLNTIDAGAMELDLKSVDAAELLEEVANAFDDWIARRDMTIEVEVASDATTFIADRARASQVLRNLLTNAVGFSPSGSKIRMGARREGSAMVFWVADSGRGIDPEFQKQAFERFQAKPVPGGPRGPGLGLSIVKSFVELHGGDVSLISRIEKGTTVICRFPIQGPKSGPGSPHAA